MGENGRLRTRVLSFLRWTVYLGLSLLLVAGGVAAFVYLQQTRQRPSGQKEPVSGPLVRVFEARRGPHRVAVTAYGTSRAAQEWTAIAEVPGRAEMVHARFEPGEMLPAAELLVQIDPTDARLAVERAEAELLGRREELERLDLSEKNLRQILQLQQRQLKLAEDEYDRQLVLLEKKAVAQTALAKVEDVMVTRLTAVQQTTSQLELIPVERDVAQAALSVATTQRKQATRQWEKCRIALPFAARCLARQIEPDQFVTVGQPLGRFLAMDMAEVVAQVEARKIRALFPKGIAGFEQPIDLAGMSHRDSVYRRVQIPADIDWGSPEQGWSWKGRFARITGSVDPATRTLAVVFEVPHPYAAIQPGAQPPLVPGVFCRVTAYGATLEDVVVVPRDCLHDGRVYLLRGGRLDPQSGIIEGASLRIVPVDVLVMEEDLAVIEKGIEDGDRVLLGDPTTGRTMLAAPGLPLRGKPEPNPVAPRTKVEFPADLFEGWDARQQGGAGGDRPAAGGATP